jgi:hypothetical protein
MMKECNGQMDKLQEVNKQNKIKRGGEKREKY